MEIDDHILSMINMTGIETDMVRDLENIRFESTVYRNNGRWANDSTNDTDIDNDTELIIELPSCVKTVITKKGVKKMILQVHSERSE